jgi:3-deoxy-D-manno-octulosonic acid kinase
MIDAQVVQDDGCAIVYDASVEREAQSHWFEVRWWEAQGRAVAAGTGRGSAWFISAPGTEWVLRHYRRGGLLGRLLDDRYLWLGLERTRAFAEFRLTAALNAEGLPVPRPVAARVQREGPIWRGDLITERLPAQPYSALLERGALDEALWQAAGRSIARLHAAGLDHADLNLHNLLLARDGAVFVIDLDRGVRRPPGAWRERNLARLRRSLDKLTMDEWTPGERTLAWDALRAGYTGR